MPGLYRHVRNEGDGNAEQQLKEFCVTQRGAGESFHLKLMVFIPDV